MVRSGQGRFVLLAVLVAIPTAASDLATRVSARFATRDFARTELVLPDGLPESLTVSVLRDGETVTVDLRKRSLRASGFRLRAWADGVTSEVVPPPVATYQGQLRGDARSVAAGSLGADGLSLRVFPAGGASWALRPLRTVVADAARTAHLVIEGGDWPADRACGAGDDAVASHDSPRAASLQPWCGPSGLELTEIAFDVDQIYYRDHGSDLAATTANVEGLLSEVDVFFARDARITYSLTDLIIRTTDFYLPDASNNLLDLFQQEWNTNQTAVVRDIAHLMTGQPAPGLAGLAYVGVVCDLYWCYGWSVDSAGVLGHEIGHNWSAGHCHDASPCNNMCGACLSIAPNTKDIISRFRDSRTCLLPVAPYATQVPPYAHPDTLTMSRDEAVLRLAIPVDVLANDHDANCDDLTIAGFDPASVRGAEVTLDAVGGPGGRDRLAYVPPCMPFAGSDRFAYGLDDRAGGTAIGAVAVDVKDPGLVASWPLDEGSGAVVGDRTGWARDGVVAGTPPWVTGHDGGALELNGIDQHVSVPPLDLPDLPVTITAWVRRNGALASFAGIVCSRGAGTTAGLHVGDSGDLRYTWSDDPNTYGRSSGLALPDLQWVFVALVVEPSRATLWLDDGTLRSWENAIAHVPQGFGADTQLGWDPTSAARHFAGALDDVRFYHAALDAGALREVRDGGIQADAPDPADGGFAAAADVQLSWRAGRGMVEHDVYFGRDFAAVRTATVGSREYRGRTTATTFDPPGLLAEGFTYAWRVDAIVGGVPRLGDTWLFTFRGRSPRLLHYWRLDEGSGMVTLDAVSGVAAELRDGASFTAGRYTAAIDFDGVDDVVAAPLPGTQVAELTITAWIRTLGIPAVRAGLVFTRGGAATGLGFADAADLSYHWGDGQWWWTSGLTVPLDRWVFVALAVKPDGATMFLHDGIGFRAASNAVGHGPVPWSGELFFGRDPWGAPRSFAGTIDDLRIYDRGLDETDLERVRVRASRAENPLPSDGSYALTAPGSLSWVGGADVVAHELYVGENDLAVRAASSASPEFRGSLATPAWTPTGELFTASRTWYWRVDERTTSTVEPGVVWRFLRPGEVGAALRAIAAPSGEPTMLWPSIEGSESFVIERCVPTGAGGCVPVPVATVAAGVTAWVDPAATESLVWYRVASRPCLP